MNIKNKNKKTQITIIIITAFILLLSIVGAAVAIYYAQQTNATNSESIVYEVKNILLTNLNFLQV